MVGRSMSYVASGAAAPPAGNAALASASSFCASIHGHVREQQPADACGRGGSPACRPDRSTPVGAGPPHSVASVQVASDSSTSAPSARRPARRTGRCRRCRRGWGRRGHPHRVRLAGVVDRPHPHRDARELDAAAVDHGWKVKMSVMSVSARSASQVAYAAANRAGASPGASTGSGRAAGSMGGPGVVAAVHRERGEVAAVVGVQVGEGDGQSAHGSRWRCRAPKVPLPRSSVSCTSPAAAGSPTRATSRPGPLPEHPSTVKRMARS